MAEVGDVGFEGGWRNGVGSGHETQTKEADCRLSQIEPAVARKLWWQRRPLPPCVDKNRRAMPALRGSIDYFFCQAPEAFW
jgi:hypothetical protein